MKPMALVLLSIPLLTGCASGGIGGTGDIAYWVDASYKPSMNYEIEQEILLQDELAKVQNAIGELVGDSNTGSILDENLPLNINVATVSNILSLLRQEVPNVTQSKYIGIVLTEDEAKSLSNHMDIPWKSDRTSSFIIVKTFCTDTSLPQDIVEKVFKPISDDVLKKLAKLDEDGDNIVTTTLKEFKSILSEVAGGKYYFTDGPSNGE